MPIVAQFLARDLQGRSLQNFLDQLTKVASSVCHKYGSVNIYFEPDPILGLRLKIVADSSTMVEDD